VEHHNKSRKQGECECVFVFVALPKTKTPTTTSTSTNTNLFHVKLFTPSSLLLTLIQSYNLILIYFFL